MSKRTLIIRCQWQAHVSLDRNSGCLVKRHTRQCIDQAALLTVKNHHSAAEAKTAAAAHTNQEIGKLPGNKKWKGFVFNVFRQPSEMSAMVEHVTVHILSEHPENAGTPTAQEHGPHNPSQKWTRNCAKNLGTHCGCPHSSSWNEAFFGVSFLGPAILTFFWHLFHGKTNPGCATHLPQ